MSAVCTISTQLNGCEFHTLSMCSQQLAVPHSEDWSRFARTLVEIRANQGDGEEEGTLEMAA